MSKACKVKSTENDHTMSLGFDMTSETKGYNDNSPKSFQVRDLKGMMLLNGT